VLHAVQVLPLPKYPLLHVQTTLPVEVSQSALALQMPQPGAMSLAGSERSTAGPPRSFVALGEPEQAS
jgi:hypothetical protein